MNHVFVETNWVVEYAAPAYFRADYPDAQQLLDRARSGEFTLELPSICIAESRRAILTRFAPKQAFAGQIVSFLRWSREQELLDDAAFDVGVRATEKMEREIRRDLDSLDARLDTLRTLPGLNIFEMGNVAAERCASLSFRGLDLQPFDQMILSSILVRAEELGRSGLLSFCEKDKDLQPWTKDGRTKPGLVELYDRAEIWVCGDFSNSSPPRPADWS